MNRLSILITFIAAAISFTGCAHQSTKVEKEFGTSFRIARQGQILNQDAGMSLKPVEGMDSAAAAAAMEQYRESFEKPCPAQTYNFSIGSSGN